jgi:hypothetical protein
MNNKILTRLIGILIFVLGFTPFDANAKSLLASSIKMESLFSQAIPAREKPRIENGSTKEGWIHIDARHVAGNDPKGPGDLFPTGTTRSELEKLAEIIVLKGTLISSDPNSRIKNYEDRVKIKNKNLRVRVTVDSKDKNRVITMFPVLSE